MVLRRVVFGIAGALLASTAMAQTVIPQNIERATNTNVQPYAPVDTRQGNVQAFSPQEFRAAPRGYAPTDARTGWSDNRANPVRETAAPSYQQAPAGYQPPEYRPDYRQPPAAAVDYRQPQQAPAIDYRQPAAAPVVDYRQQQPARPLMQPAPYAPADTRPAVQPVNQPSLDPRVQAQPYRPSYQQDVRQPPLDGRPPVQDFRNPAGATRLPPGVQPAAVETQPRYPVYEARPGVVDPRVVVPRREEYIDYKVLDGRTYDFRPLDFKPVDARTLEYRSQDNRQPDQKVLDPRLKDKGPEIQTTLECKAIMYRAVECNFLDYREVDPQLQELFAKYPEVAFGIVPKEYSKEVIERWQPLLAHLSREIGLKISLKIANDYQALIESQRAGLVHVAIYSPMAYARAKASGVKVDAFAVETNPDGGKGAHALIYAMNGAGAPRGDEMKGKSIGFVDPNSISGYFVPRMMLASQKLDPDSYLGKQVFTGSHENALTALSQGLVDLAVGEWRSDEDSTLARLLGRGAFRNADGTPMRRDDFRVIAKSELLVNSPIAYLSELPEDLKGIIRRAMLEAPMRDRAAFEKVYDAKGRNWDVIEGKSFDSAVELVKFMEDSRTRQQAALARQQTTR